MKYNTTATAEKHKNCTSETRQGAVRWGGTGLKTELWGVGGRRTHGLGSMLLLRVSLVQFVTKGLLINLLWSLKPQVQKRQHWNGKTNLFLRNDTVKADVQIWAVDQQQVADLQLQQGC